MKPLKALCIATVITIALFALLIGFIYLAACHPWGLIVLGIAAIFSVVMWCIYKELK